MNRYGQMTHEHSRRHRPAAYLQIPDPVTFFAEVGQEISTAVSATRDELLGPMRPGETPEAYRIRSYQALAAAEELTLATHPFLQPELTEATEESEATDEDWSDDPDLAHRFRVLAEINQAIHSAE